jgi:2-C-methyl-D-erythritol 4-phosphate cytidylyltransferase
MRKAFALALIASILAVIAYLTKPSDEVCVTKAKEEFKETKLPAVSTPQKINTQLLAEALEKNFLSSLVIEDNFLYKEIYQDKGAKTKIGWGAFGWVNVELK